MALENFDLNLTNVVATAKGSFGDSSADVSITSSNATVKAVTKSVGSAKLEGFGTLNADASDVVSFVADANMKSGAYSATMATAASISTFDASKASANLSLTTSLVSVKTGTGVLKGGLGNDNIVVDANDSTGLQVFGGKGADTFELKSGTVKATVVDYNYAEGDKISLGSAAGIASLGTDGKMTINATTVNGYGADNVYKFGVITPNDKYDYVGAIQNADVKYTAGTDKTIFKANGTGNVVVDASKAAATSILATVKNADITLGGTKDTTNIVSVGAGAGSTAIVDLSYGQDTVSVDSSATALTLKVGKEDGVANSLGSVLDANDTLVLTAGKIGDISMAGNDKTDLQFGATSIAGAFAKTDVGTFNVQFGSDEAKKLAYSTTDSKAIAYSKDNSYYLGITDGIISVATGNTDDVVLDMVNCTSGITSVGLANTSAKANVDITATGKATVSVGVAHDDVEWKFDLTASDGAKANLLDVSNTKGVDRITLSDVEGNADSVKGFNAGEDILHLSNVDKLTESTFSVAGASTDVLLTNSKASINGAISATANLDVVLADGTAKKVALTKSDNHIATATQKTTTVINQTADAAKVDFNITEATENNAAFVVDMTGTVSNAIDYLGKFTSIDATVSAANALIIGNEAITSIKATGSADHSAVVWAGAKANATIEFDNVATNAGNILWTGALDGASTVKGFEDKDKLYVYGVDGLSKAAVADGFGIDGNNVVYKTGDSSMTFNTAANTAGNINVMYMDSTVEGGYGYKKVAYTNTDTTAVNFNTDVDVYIGTGNASVKVANDAVAEGKITAINLSNKGAGSVEEGGAYYKGIHNIDAAGSAGTFLLIGDNTDGAKLTGGVNGNAIWGGGNAGQTMTGSNGAADIFWFGSNDGYDEVTNFGTKDGDSVFLYDATSIDAVQITAEGGNAKVVFKDTSCTLTLTGVSNIDDVKFMLNAADGGYAYYKYDSKTSAFVQQKA